MPREQTQGLSPPFAKERPVQVGHMSSWQIYLQGRAPSFSEYMSHPKPTSFLFGQLWELSFYFAANSRLYHIYYNAFNLWNWVSKLSEDKNVELWRVILFDTRCLLQLVQSQYFFCFGNDLDVYWTGWAVYSSTICQTFQLDSNFGRGSRSSKSSPLSHCFLPLFGRHVTGLNLAWTLGTRVHWQMLTWNFHGSRFAERMSQYPWMVSLSPLRPIVL